MDFSKEGRKGEGNLEAELHAFPRRGFLRDLNILFRVVVLVRVVCLVILVDSVNDVERLADCSNSIRGSVLSSLEHTALECRGP